MKLIWDHTFGKQEHQDLVICNPRAEVDPAEEAEAIHEGWLALDTPVRGKEVFYQSRSTRICINKWRPRFKDHKWKGEDIKIKVIEASELVKLLGLSRIYKNYMARKKFTADYNPLQHYHRRDRFMLFYTGTADNIIAFTKQKRYLWDEDYAHTIDDFENLPVPAGIESVIHANLVPISAITLDLEIMHAAQHHVRHYYLGSGYEQSSEYKASYRGFEWWNGVKWSTNKRLYRRLCRRDTKLTEFYSLGNLSLIEDKS